MSITHTLSGLFITKRLLYQTSHNNILKGNYTGKAYINAYLSGSKTFNCKAQLCTDRPMWSILHMTVMSLVAAVVPRTGQIIKNGLSVFERGENLLQNVVLHICI